MKLNKLFACALLACGMFALADLPMKNRFYFDDRNWFKPYPGNEAEKFSLDSELYEGHGSLKIQHSGSMSTCYSGFMIDNAPGELEVKLNCRAVGSAKLNLRLNFNVKDGGNGSAGSFAKDIPLSDKWESQGFHCVVPPDAVGMQLVFTATGDDSTIWINSPFFGVASDTVQIPVSDEPMNLDVPLSDKAWNPAQQLSAFYSLGSLTMDETRCQLAANDEGLYVAFKNTGKPDKAQFEADSHDQPLWEDDCNELFLYNNASGNGWHFIVNSKGALFDGRMYQKQAGDPWKTDETWNSNGVKTLASVNENGWESRIFVPWSDLKLTFEERMDLSINLCRENKSLNIDSQWNAMESPFGNPIGFGILVIENGRMTVTRNRKASVNVYTVDRKSTVFEELLEKGTPGNYMVSAWSHGFEWQSFPKDWMESEAGKADFERWQKQLMKNWGEAGMIGPAFPWVQNNLIGKGDELIRLNEKYGMKFSYSLHNSSHSRMAREKGAKYILPRDNVLVSPLDPVQRDVMLDSIHELSTLSWFPLTNNRVGFLMGYDEPFNGCTEIFSKSLNKENADALDELDAFIKEKYGFGKYGLPDYYAEYGDDTPFMRIAFNRWQNDVFLENSKLFMAELKKLFPDAPYFPGANNTCGGLSPMDYAIFDGVVDMMACDPYPTSATYVYGNARALYHTGFSTKIESDLAPRTLTLVMPQNFIYCGGKPSVDSTIEWASQAMKNGAEGLMWYCENAIIDIPDCYCTVIAINKLVHNMDKIKFPEKTETAVLFSLYDQYALADNVQNAAYSVYSILGEHVGTSFRFVSTSSLALGQTKLADYKVVYVPKLTYTTPELTAQLMEFVERGGTLIVFDPRFLSWNIDGTAVEEQVGFTGVGKRVARDEAKSLLYGGLELPLSPNAYITLPTGMSCECYAFEAVTGNVVATYPDGSAAAVEKEHGAGRLVLFAAQPFGNADLAVAPGKWSDFFRAEATKTDQKTDLPIWRFQIPKDALEQIELVPFSKK